jgi:hypothetical protein
MKTLRGHTPDLAIHSQAVFPRVRWVPSHDDRQDTPHLGIRFAAVT